MVHRCLFKAYNVHSKWFAKVLLKSSRGICVESGRVLGLGFRLDFVNFMFC
jgi:hypothetical protein